MYVPDKHWVIALRCLSRYHIFGQTTGALNVIVEQPNIGESKTVWNLFGSAGDKWIQASVPLPAADFRQDYQVCSMTLFYWLLASIVIAETIILKFCQREYKRKIGWEGVSGDDIRGL